MADPFDVSLRVKLERAGFDEGKRDLAEVRRAADKLGQSEGADRLSRDLRSVERAAGVSERDLGKIRRAADQIGTTHGADRLVRELKGVERAAGVTERDLGQVRRAASQLGTTQGADRLVRDLKSVERAAGVTERDLGKVRRAADQLGVTKGVDALSRDLGQARRAAATVETAIGEVDKAAGKLNRDELGRFQRSMQAGAHSVDDVKAALVAADGARDRLNRDELGRFRRSVGASERDVDGLKRKIDETTNSREKLDRAGRAAGFLDRSVRSGLTALGAYAAPAAILAGLDQVRDKFLEVDRAAAGAAITMESLDPKVRAGIITENKKFGGALGASQTDIQGARDVFKSGGVSLADQTTLLPPTLKAAIGAGAPAETLARAGMSAVQNLGVKAGETGLAYDMMSKASKLGTVEMEDIARNLPQLGPLYKGLGGTGPKGLAELLAMAEVSAKGAGSADEGMNNLVNYLSKITSPETVANFKKKGVNLPKLFERSKQEDKNPALAVLDETMRITKGDPFKIGQLFGDMQVMSALRPLMDNRKQLDAWTKDIATGSAGTGEKDYAYRLTTPSGQEDVQRAKREVSQISIGEAVAPGAGLASRAYTSLLQRGATIAEGFTSGGFWEGAKRTLQSPALGAIQAGTGDEVSDAAKAAAGGALLEMLSPAGLLKLNQQAGQAPAGPKEESREELEGQLQERRGQLDVQRMRENTLSIARGGPDPDGKVAAAQAANTEKIESLTAAIRDLEQRLAELTKTPIDPIAFRNGSESAAPRLWNASYGGSGGGGSGGGRFAGYGLGDGGSVPRSAYAASAPVMDGMANTPEAQAGAARAAAVAGAGPRGALSTTRNPGGAAGEVYDVLAADFNDPQALALLGHMQQESQFNPEAWNAKEGAGGLLQWRGNRLANLQAFAKSKGMDWRDRKVQAAYVSHEMRTDPYERRRSAGFRNATTLEEASAELKNYVRFGDNTAGTRLANARQFADQFGARATSAGAAVPASVAASGGRLDPVTYANRGATRDRPVTPELLEQIQRGVTAVYGPGYSAQIYSGGQGAKGSGLARVGSTRHDDHGQGGMAADLYVTGPDGNRVTGDELAKLGQHWVATGQGGVGLEMRGGGIHLDQHKDRAKHWNYAGQGGRYTRGQRALMERGLAGIPPAYVAPGALSPGAIAAGVAPVTADAEKPKRPMPSWADLTTRPTQEAVAAGSEATTAGVPRGKPRPPAPKARPEFEAPSTAGSASGGRGRVAPTLTVNQHINGGFDAKVAADRSRREQHRAMRMADARAMHDTMVPIS